MSGKLQTLKIVRFGDGVARHFLRGFGLFLVLGMALGSGVDASAQVKSGDADPSMYSSHRVSLQKAHFNEMISMVIVDAQGEEALLARGLYAGYTAAWAEAARVARDEMKMIRTDGRGSGPDGYKEVQLKIRARQQAFANEASAMEAQFFADVQVFLTKEQAGRWGKYEQARRRRLYLRRYRRLSGEDIDMIRVMDDLAFELVGDVAVRIAELLDGYGDELDVALQARQAMLPVIKRKLEAIRSGESSSSGEQFYKSEVYPRHLALREINDRFGGDLERELPLIEGQIFRKQLDKLRYPRVFSTTQADRYLERMNRELDDLSSKQESEIDRLWNEYELEISSIIARLIELQRERDEAVPPQYRLASLGVVSGGSEGVEKSAASLASNGNSGLLAEESKLWRRRRDIEEKLIESWFGLLTPAQQALVPPKPLVFQPGGRPDVPHDGGGEDDGGEI